MSSEKVRRAVFSLIAACLIIAAALYAGFQHRQARTAEAAASSTALVQQALALQNGDPTAAARLAIAAYRLAPTPQAADALGTLAQLDSPVKDYLRVDTWSISDLTQSPDGRFVYASSQNGALRAWDVATGAVVAQTDPGTALTGLAINPSGTILTGINSEGNLLAWNSQTLQSEPVPSDEGFLEGVHGSTVIDAGFYDDGNRYFALTTSGDLISEAWPDDPSPLSTSVDTMLKQAGQPTVSSQTASEATAADLSSGQAAGEAADTLYVATTDGRVLAVDLDNETAAVAIGSYLTGITSIALDPSGDGELAVVANGTGAEYSLSSGRQTSTIPGVTADTWGIGFDDTGPSGSYYILAGNDGVTLQPTTSDTDGSSTGEATAADALLEEPHGTDAQAVAFPTGAMGGSDFVAVGSANGLITILDPALAGLALTAPQPSTVAAFDTRGDLLLAGLTNQNAATFAYSIDPDSPVQPSANQSYAVARLYPTPTSWWAASDEFFANSATLDRDFAVVAGQSPQGQPVVLVWNAKTGAPVRELQLPDVPSSSTPATPTPAIATAAVDDPALGLIVARESTGTVIGWSTTTWKPVLDLDTGAPGSQIALTPDGASAVINLDFARSGTNSPDSAALGFINLRTRALHEVHIPVAAEDIAVSPTTGNIAIQGADSLLRFYYSDGTEDGQTDALQGIGAGLAYNPAGTELAVTTSSGTLVLDAATRTQLSPLLPAPPGAYTDAPTWSPNGAVLVVLTGVPLQTGASATLVAGSPQLWDVNPQDWRQRLCELSSTDASLATGTVGSSSALTQTGC